MKTQDILAYGVLFAAVFFIALVLMGAAPAQPASIRPDLEPPAEFLVNPGGVEIELRSSSFSVDTCSWFTGKLDTVACAIFPESTENGKCLIIFPPPHMKFGRDPWLSLILRHEIAHCYGWRH
jgi:hypothetical protein